MKKCTVCGKENRDENTFCSECGNNTFEPTAVQPVYTAPVQAEKPEFTKFDLMSILGFVSSLVGIFYIGLILEPLAAITTIVGFVKGKRNRGLAAAGFVIAVIALLVRLFYTLYVNGVIPKWLISGSFDI